MLRRDRDPRRAEWLETLIAGTVSEIGKTVNGREGEEFSVFLATVLQLALLTDGREPGQYGGHAFPLADASRVLMVPSKTVKRYLQASAQAGILKCVTWFDESRKRRFPLEVIINPELAKSYGTTTLGTARELGKAFGGLWLERRNYLKPMQGFSLQDTVPWGRFVDGEGFERASRPIQEEDRDEPEALPRIETGAEDPVAARIRAAAAGGKKTVDAVKAESKKKSRELEAKFVEGASIVWMTIKQRNGFDCGAPAWAATVGLCAEQTRERRALISMFNTYGGRVAALAWNCFCGAKVRRDEKGRAAFLPEFAHGQWTTPDKKPSHFAKHINLVIQDVVGRGWHQDESLVEKLRTDAFGDSIDVQPRDPIFASLNPAGGSPDGNQKAAATPSW